MARRRYNEEDILRLLRETELHLHGGRDVVSACHTAPSPTRLCKKIEEYAQTPALGGWLGFGRGPTLTVSCRHGT